MTGADESGASSSGRNPDVTGCFYNVFNAVMTDNAFIELLQLIWKMFLELCCPFCLTPPRNKIHMLFLLSLIV